MVRGDLECDNFCPDCEADCRCDTCSKCHNCVHTMIFERGYLYWSGKLFGCLLFRHACDITSDPAWKKTVTASIVNFPKLLQSQSVEIRIGRDPPETRLVPKSLLIANSEYFKRFFSFQDQSASAQTSIILDSEVDRVDAFDCFIQFAFLNDYKLRADDEEKESDIALHANVYVLAERLQADRLKSLAAGKASALAAKHERLRIMGDVKFPVLDLAWILGAIDAVYGNTPSTPNFAEDEENSTGLNTSKDRFRTLLAIICAKVLKSLSKMPSFEARFRMFDDFAVDLLEQTQVVASSFGARIF